MDIEKTFKPCYHAFSQSEGNMLQAQFKNGLPVKPIEHIGVLQDFEKHPQNSNPDKTMKIMVIDKKYIDKTSGNLVGVYFIDGILYFDYDDMYLVCDELMEETKQFLSKGGVFILSQFHDNVVKSMKKITI